MLNKEDILALAWEHSEESGKRYTFTEENLFEFLKKLKKYQAAAHDEREITELIDQRDNAEDWANKLSDAIASHTGAYIGEHSNMNCPWASALEAIENTRPHRADRPAAGAEWAGGGARRDRSR